MEVSASLGENTLAAGPHTIANINIKPTTSSKKQAYALQLAALQLLKKGMHLWLTNTSSFGQKCKRRFLMGQVRSETRCVNNRST
jgi:hypothetical protein